MNVLNLNVQQKAMKIKRGEIILKNLQVKSLEKAKKLAYALNIIEEECGIHEVKITFENFFICPWIKTEDLNNTEMEILVSDIFKQIK